MQEKKIFRYGKSSRLEPTRVAVPQVRTIYYRKRSMTQYIHYEANISMLNDMLKHVQRSLKVDIDNDYFLEKIKSDILFAESKLAAIYESLKDSTLQLDKAQYFRHLYKTKSLFLEIAENILNDNTGRSLDFTHFNIRLKDAVLEQQFECDDIGKILAKTDADEIDKDQISQEELMFLMSHDEEAIED